MTLSTVDVYRAHDPPVTLEADIAAEHPLYIFLDDERQCAWYSVDIRALMARAKVRDTLNISSTGVSFLLQNGVIPTPATIFDKLYVLGIGDRAAIDTKNGCVSIEFGAVFPFWRGDREFIGEPKSNDTEILQLLAEATIARLEPARPNILFHSAGKDSNMIALALAEAGWQDRVTLACFESNSIANESDISAWVAKKLGFSHVRLKGATKLDAKSRADLEEYHRCIPFPTMDGVGISYPLCMGELQELRGANVIDGMGNDVYIGHVPSAKEYRRQRLLSPVGDMCATWRGGRSNSIVASVVRTRAERTGLWGFTFSDAQRIYSEAVPARPYWKRLSDELRGCDDVDFRAAVRGRYIDTEIYMRKVRNFGESICGSAIFPWANEDVARYFWNLPEDVLFDRRRLKNKLVLRDILKRRMELDVDRIGKRGFVYDYRAVIRENYGWVENEIRSCEYWDRRGIESTLAMLRKGIYVSGRKGSLSAKLTHRLYALSAWLKHRA